MPLNPFPLPWAKVQILLQRELFSANSSGSGMVESNAVSLLKESDFPRLLAMYSARELDVESLNVDGQ